MELSVVATNATWASFWRNHSDEAAPVVDFCRYVVLALYREQVGGGGYDVRIENVTWSSGAFRADYILTHLCTGQGGAAVMSQPHHFVKVHRRSPGTPTATARLLEDRCAGG